MGAFELHLNNSVGKVQHEHNGKSIERVSGKKMHWKNLVGGKSTVGKV